MKRFYDKVDVRSAEGGFGVALDGKLIRTPAGQPLLLPTPALADAVATEWAAVPDKGEIRPLQMPLTRLAATAIDRIAPQPHVVTGDVIGYARSDLLCYRADGPVELVARQAAGWDPVLYWARTHLGATFRTTAGVMPIDQDAASVAAVEARISGYEPFILSALFSLTTALGSVLLAIAVVEGLLTAEQAADLAEIDFTWQTERWGADSEALKRRDAMRKDIAAAGRMLGLLITSG